MALAADPGGRIGHAEPNSSGVPLKLTLVFPLRKGGDDVTPPSAPPPSPQTEPRWDCECSRTKIGTVRATGRLLCARTRSGTEPSSHGLAESASGEADAAAASAAAATASAARASALRTCARRSFVRWKGLGDGTGGDVAGCGGEGLQRGLADLEGSGGEEARRCLRAERRLPSGEGVADDPVAGDGGEPLLFGEEVLLVGDTDEEEEGAESSKLRPFLFTSASSSSTKSRLVMMPVPRVRSSRNRTARPRRRYSL